MKHLPRPRVGFVGGIDIHTFDPDLFVRVATMMPETCFVLVGACSLPEGWCDLPNVRFVGRVPYDEVAGYMGACDVLLMPWNGSDWIRACNPVKLKEYLAVGRPIVSTPFDELEQYQGLVRVAKGPEAFAEAVREALRRPGDPGPGRARVERETWAAKSEGVRAALLRLGVGLGGTGPADR
jgi:glycosyltransferase involved in cell wall biosynthesis